KRKSNGGVGRLSGNKHVMRPNEETNHGDGDTGAGDEGVAEDGFARKSRDNFADHPHGWQNHDVNSRVRVKPEQVLKEDGVAAKHRIEKPEVEHALEAYEQKCDGDDRRSQNENNA